VAAAVAAWAAWELEQCLDPKHEKRWKNAGFDQGNFGENWDFTYEKWWKRWISPVKNGWNMMQDEEKTPSNIKGDVD